MKCVILFAALLTVSLAQLDDAPVTEAVVPEAEVPSVEIVPESDVRAAPSENPVAPEEGSEPSALRPEGRYLSFLPKYRKPYYSTTQPSWISRYFGTSTTVAPTKKTTVFDIVTPSIKYYNADRNAEVVQYENEINPDGSYKYGYELTNSIKAGEEGQIVSYNDGESGMAARGFYSFVSNDGVPISVSYIADKNGFQPQSDAIPTSPPIPPAIQRAVEWVLARKQQSERF